MKSGIIAMFGISTIIAAASSPSFAQSSSRALPDRVTPAVVPLPAGSGNQIIQGTSTVETRNKASVDTAAEPVTPAKPTSPTMSR